VARRSDARSKTIGPEVWARCISNDSQTPLGSIRDRHANIGAGELGEEGCTAFLCVPAFGDLPCVLETPGQERSGATRAVVQLAMCLREHGLAATTVRGSGSG
jgi:deoxyribonuclease-4